MEKFWNILGIEETKDEELVKKAYREKLVKVNPEDNPEGFKELRKSYEDALIYIKEDKNKNTFDNPEDEDDVSKWMRKVKDTYFNLPDRISEKKWNELLDDNVCMGLDTSEDAKDKLLVFLMDNFRLPHVIWKLIDKCFYIVGDQEKLYEKYPRNFIDFVCNSSRYEDFFDFYLFDGPEFGEYDQYIEKYFKVKGMLDYNEVDGFEKELKELKEDMIYHPYEDVEQVRWLLKTDKKTQAKETINKLYESYKDCNYVLLYVGQVYLELDDIENSKKYFEILLEKVPNHYTAKLGWGKCLVKEGKYYEAKEWFIDMLYAFNNDRNVLSEMYAANDYLIDIYMNKLQEIPDDFESIRELGWCYFQNERFNDSINLLKDIEVSEENKVAYSNLLGRSYVAVGDFKNAYPHLLVWLEDLETIEDDGSEEAAKKLRNFGYAYYVVALCINNSDEESEETLQKVLHYIQKAIDKEKTPNSIYMYQSYRAQVFLKYKRNEDCIDECDKILKDISNYYPAYIHRQEAYYNLGNYQGVIDDYYNATDIDSKYEMPYILAIKTFHMFSKYEDCLNIIKRAEENEIDSKDIKLYKAKVLRLTLKTIGEVEEQAYKLILDLKEEHKVNDYGQKFYLDILYEEADICVAMYKFEDALTAINEAVEICDDTEYLFYKGYIHHELKDYNEAIKIFTKLEQRHAKDEKITYRLALAHEKQGNNREAIENYKKVIEINPEKKDAYYGISEVLERDASRYSDNSYYEQSLEYRHKLIEIDPCGYSYLLLGLTLSRLGRAQEAIENYLKSIELDPTNPFPYNNIGVRYHHMGDYEKAVEYYLKSIENIETDKTPLPVENVAISYRALKNYDKALEYYKKGMEMFPEEEYFYEDLGLMYQYQKMYDEALELYMKKLDEGNKEDKEISKLKKSIGYTYELKGDDSKALYWYKNLVGSQNKKCKSDGYEVLGDFYFFREKNLRSLYYYKQALKHLDSKEYHDRASLLFFIGVVSKDLGFASEKYFKEAIENYIKDYGSEEKYFRDNGYLLARYYSITRVYIYMGDLETAQKYIDNMCNYQKCYRCSYGKCYERIALQAMMEEVKGNTSEALKLYREAVEFEPTYFYGLARIRKLGSKK